MCPESAGPHCRQHRLDHIDRTEVVDIEQLSDLGVFALLDRGQIAVAGVVDQHIDSAECHLRRRDRGSDLAGVGHVESNRNGAVPELVDEVLHRIGPSRGHHHTVAVLKRCPRDLAPKAGGASGDQPTRHQCAPGGPGTLAVGGIGAGEQRGLAGLVGGVA